MARESGTRKFTAGEPRSLLDLMRETLRRARGLELRSVHSFEEAYGIAASINLIIRILTNALPNQRENLLS